MAEENQNISHGGYQQPPVTTTHEEEEPEIKDRGIFDFLGKKKEEEKEEEKVPTADHQNVVIATELEHLHVSGDQCEDEQPEKKVVVHEVEKEEEEKKPHTSLLDKLHRCDSSSSSSSDEEVEENGEKIRRKKKGLKDRVHEHIGGDTKVEEPEKKIDYYKEEDTAVPVEKCDDVVVTHDGVVPHPEEKKGFIEKIKEKFPGGQKKTEEDQVTHPVAPVPTAHPAECTSTTDSHDGEEVKEKKGFLEKIKEKLPGFHKSEEEEKKDTPTHY